MRGIIFGIDEMFVNILENKIGFWMKIATNFILILAY